MSDLILVFQKNNVTACRRFHDYLRDHGWAKISAGVYHKLNGRSVDRENIWAKAEELFSFDKDLDFLAIFPSGKFFIPTRRYYMKQAPPWPYDDPYLLEVATPSPDPDSPSDTSPE
jgi:hypothetical protein